MVDELASMGAAELGLAALGVAFWTGDALFGGDEGEAAIVGDEAALEVPALGPAERAAAFVVLDGGDPGGRGGAPGEAVREAIGNAHV